MAAIKSKTPERVAERIRTDFKAGMTNGELVRKYKKASSTISRITGRVGADREAESLNVKREIHRLAAEGMGRNEIVRKLKVSENTVTRALREKLPAEPKKDKPTVTLELPPTLAAERQTYDIDRKGNWLVLSDVHLPFHDITTVKLAVERAKKDAVVGVVLNGDILDSHEVSDHSKDPSAPRYQQEIEVGKQFLQWLRSQLPKAEMVYKRGNHECFDTETEILTSSGWLKHDELTDDTLVASYRQSDRVIEYSRPLAIHRSQFDGEMVSIKSMRCDLLITPNHRILYRPGGSGIEGAWRTEPFSNIPVGNNRIVIPASGVSGNGEYPLTDDEIKIAAWTITDGCVSKAGRVGYSQRPQKVHLITDILDRLGWKYSMRVRQRNITAICGKTLVKPCQPSCEIGLLNPFNAKAVALAPTNRHLPTWVYSLSERQFRIFIESVIDGDGSRHPNNPDTAWMVYGRKPLLDDLQAAAVTHGFRASISEYRPNTWRLNLFESGTLAIDKLEKRVSRVPYSGVVWCVTTTNDTVVVRRNNKVAITGNSRLDRYILGRAPALFDLEGVNLRSLLHFSDLGIDDIDDKRAIRLGKLYLLHGHEYRGSGGVNPARWLYLKARFVAMCGHFHRTSEHHDRNIDDKLEAAWSTGCACELSPHYMPYTSWNHGFAMVDVGEDGDFHVRNMRVINGKIY